MNTSQTHTVAIMALSGQRRCALPYFDVACIEITTDGTAGATIGATTGATIGVTTGVTTGATIGAGAACCCARRGMNAPATDLFGQAIAPTATIGAAAALSPDLLVAEAMSLVEPLVADRTLSPKQRIETLWSGVYAARDLGTADIVGAAFLDLARKTGLVVALGGHGTADVRHVIWWALRGLDPFDREPVR